MTDKQAREVVLRVRAKHPRSYKRLIHDVWMTGAYEHECLAEFLPELQQVRNIFGPSWLERFRP